MKNRLRNINWIEEAVSMTYTEEVENLIKTHIQRYPEIDIVDCYKLLHQGAFGPGHAISRRRAAWEWLENETQNLTPDPDALFIESVHPQSEVLRLHLRPYMAFGGDLYQLLEAFIKSAEELEREDAEQNMAKWWDIFHEMCETALANRFDSRTVHLIGHTRSLEHWPAIQHSPPYEAIYKPAYRLLSKDQTERLLTRQHIPFEIA